MLRRITYSRPVKDLSGSGAARFCLKVADKLVGDHAPHNKRTCSTLLSAAIRPVNQVPPRCCFSNAKARPIFSFSLSFSLSLILTKVRDINAISNPNFKSMAQFINFVGIDMAKNDFYACFNDTTEPEKFNNDGKGIKAYFRQLKRLGFKENDTLLGVESTASYHLKLCISSVEADWRINVINPLIVKKQNQTDLRKVKTDKHDSKLIRFCLANGAGYPFTHDPEAFVLRNLVRQRDALAQLKLELNRKQSDIRLKEQCIRQEISPVYADLIDILGTKINVLKNDLCLYRPKERYLLQSIPGVGPITAVSFISEVGDITRFAKPEQLVAYAGLDPRVHQSGTSINGKGYISKRGNKILRTRLFNAASVAVLHDNQFKIYFNKKRAEGKPYRVALVAVMRKMAHVIHAVWSRGTPYVT